MGRIIGFCGYARSGKDEAVRALVAKGFKRVAFADQLKEEVCRTMGLSKGMLELTKGEWRPLLVEWGRGRRRMDPDYWINKVAANLPEGDVAISDVRYPNEAKWIWSLGGFLIRMIRPGVEANNEEERVTIAEVDRLNRRCFMIDNSGTVQDLHAKVETLWRNL